MRLPPEAWLRLRRARRRPLAFVLACAFAFAIAAAAAGCGRTALNLGDGGGGTDAAPTDGAPPPPDAGGVCDVDPDCDDGIACNGPERCAGGACQAGGPVSCDDELACTVDSCAEPAGCQHVPDHDLCEPGQLCDPVAGCVAVGCMTSADCDDGLFCDGVELCGPDGFCAGGPPPMCADFVTCTADACNEATDACSNVPMNALCDDGLFCNGAETCVPPVGCAAGVAPACGDGDACTIDLCDESSGACAHLPRDLDLDGFGDALCGGTDCLDTSPAVNPGASELCANAVDDDCDALLDCDDPACAPIPICSMTCVPFEAACADGFDEDCDGSTDCADGDCTGVPPCPAACAPVETSCTNGVDDDCDGAPDCLDAECAPNPGCGMCMPFESCANGADDDCDALVDCDDPACVADPACIVCIGSEVCLNFNDDDCDGDIDCDDSDCSGTIFCAFCLPVEVCTGGGDEDCDGDVDCDDSGCASDPSCLPGCQVESCVNLVDDDCDGFIDCTDADCSGNTFCNLCIGFELCFGLRDDDCDGLIDCGDDDCAGTTACSVCTAESCANGADDDCDSLIDCADPDCLGTSLCGESYTPDGVLDCGGTDFRSNFGPGSTDAVTAYACGATGQTAGELAYTFTPAAGGAATVTLSALTADVNLFVLGPGGTPACDPDVCLAQSAATGPVGETASFAVTAGTTYRLVVDGPGAAMSNFTIAVACGAAGPEACADGVDNDLDGSIDCDDPECAMEPSCTGGGSCTPAEATSCGDTSSGNNGAAGSTDVVDGYGGSCAVAGDDGPEYVHSFVAAADGFVAATIGGLTADLDLFALDGGAGGACDPDACMASSTLGGTAGESVIFPVTAGNSYHIVVDGFAGAGSDYTLTVFCTMM